MLLAQPGVTNIVRTINLECHSGPGKCAEFILKAGVEKAQRALRQSGSMRSKCREMDAKRPDHLGCVLCREFPEARPGRYLRRNGHARRDTSGAFKVSSL